MPNEKFLQLLNSPLNKTREGKIRWHETASPLAFRVAFNAGLVRVEARYEDDDETGEGYYAVLLLNRQGQVIDSLWSENDTVPKGFLREVYATARASARQADEIIDSMLKDAEAGKTVEPPKDYLGRE